MPLRHARYNDMPILPPDAGAVTLLLSPALAAAAVSLYTPVADICFRFRLILLLLV